MAFSLVSREEVPINTSPYALAEDWRGVFKTFYHLINNIIVPHKYSLWHIRAGRPENKGGPFPHQVLFCNYKIQRYQ